MIFLDNMPQRLDSGATPLFAGLFIGSLATPRSSDPGFSIFRTLTGAGNSHGFSEQSEFAKAAGTAFSAFDGRFLVSGTNNYDHFVSFQASPVLSTSGTTTNLYGVFALPSITAGTLTNAYGLYVASPTVGGGTITNNWGLYVEAPVSGSANNYAATFMGKVGIGKNPAYLLDIAGTSPRIQLFDSNTGYAIVKIGNTTGSVYIGKEAAAGGAILTGATANSNVILGDGAYPLHFGINATLAMTLKVGGVLNLVTAPNYANNAAAISGGLAAGDIYRTSGALQIVI